MQTYSLLQQTFIVLVAMEFFYIMYLETFATTSKHTAKVFRMDIEELSSPSIVTLFKNQGIYNGLIGLALLIATFVIPSPITVIFFLILIVLVALYGGISSHPSIFFKQGSLAILALLSMLL